MKRALGWLCAALAGAVVCPASAKPAPKQRRSKAIASYQSYVRKWHEKEPGAKAPSDERGRPKLVLEAINLRERVELDASTDEGGFDESARTRAAHVLRDSSRNGEHAMDPGLLELLYKIQRHFDAPCIRVVSAYRVPRGGRVSQHGKGRAADVVVPGVSDQQVWSYAKTLGPTGAGLYPVSGFVHVDVRESSHFWVDSSGPGQHAHKKPRPRKAPRRKS